MSKNQHRVTFSELENSSPAFLYVADISHRESIYQELVKLDGMIIGEIRQNPLISIDWDFTAFQDPQDIQRLGIAYERDYCKACQSLVSARSLAVRYANYLIENNPHFQK